MNNLIIDCRIATAKQSQLVQMDYIYAPQEIGAPDDTNGDSFKY